VIDAKSARIVVTMPPVSWFGGYDRRSAQVLLSALEQRFEQSFYQFDTTPFLNDDVRGQRDAVTKLKEFRPQLAMSLNNAGYGVSCAIRSGTDSLNLFTDILNIPLMLLWDHGLFQFPSLLLAPLPQQPEDSTGDAIRRVRQTINHPLMFHFPIDSGQVDEMRRIGLLQSANVTVVPALAYKPFLDFGSNHAERSYVDDIIFAGNVYLSDGYATRRDDLPIAARCHDEVLAAKREKPTVPAWTLLAERVEALSDPEKRESGLAYDQTYFWGFASRLIGADCNTQCRIDTLNSIGREVSFYGAFADPGGIPRLPEFLRRVNFKGSVDFANELPSLYARSRILVDVTNAAFVKACSTKPICCFAAGGFSLFDFKPDAAVQLGSESEKVMYRSYDELNAKIDYFLTHEHERQALARHLQERIKAEYSFTENVYESAVRILSDGNIGRAPGGWSRLKAALSGTLSKFRKPSVDIFEQAMSDGPVGPTARIERGISLSDVDIPDHWPGARQLSSAPLQIRTADGAWGYSALIPFSEQSRPAASEDVCWISVTARAVSGRVGVGLLDHKDRFVAERFLEADRASRTLFFKMPNDGIQGVLIRSGGTPSSVVEVVDIALLREASRKLRTHGRNALRGRRSS